MSVVGMDGKPVRQSVGSPPVVVPLVDDIATAIIPTEAGGEVMFLPHCMHAISGGGVQLPVDGMCFRVSISTAKAAVAMLVKAIQQYESDRSGS